MRFTQSRSYEGFGESANESGLLRRFCEVAPSSSGQSPLSAAGVHLSKPILDRLDDRVELPGAALGRESLGPELASDRNPPLALAAQPQRHHRLRDLHEPFALDGVLDRGTERVYALDQRQPTRVVPSTAGQIRV